ncbi:MAG: class I SAM-dependent methyltransferase [Rudaea sp.]
MRNSGGADRITLTQKPFRSNPAETARLLRDLAGIIQLLDLPEGAQVLDVGCGTGWTSVYLARQGYRVIGFDLAPDMIDIARRRAEFEHVDDRCDFRVADSEDFDLGCTVDAVLVYETLHHVSDERAVLSNCFRHLKPGGRLVLGEPGWMHGLRERHVTRQFGVTERGFLTRTLMSAVRQAGFTRISRLVPSHRPFMASPWQALRTSLLDLVYYFLLAGTHLQIWLVAEKPMSAGRMP